MVIEHIPHKHLTKSDYAAYIAHGITFDAYLKEFEKLVYKNKNNEPMDYPHAKYLPINLQRSERVDKTLIINPEVIEALKLLHHPTTWLVLTEYWCGDAAQNLPVFNKIATASKGKIKLVLLLRDQNPELMNSYLTSGSRSIPKLIQLDAHNNVTGIWGPRPTELQRLVTELKKNPEKANNYAEQAQHWYNNDHSQSLQKEIIMLIHKASAFCADCMI